jgi:hypothetical protein
MTHRIAAGLLSLALLLGTVVHAEEPDGPDGPTKSGGVARAPDPDQQPTWIKITVPTKASKDRALAFALQVDPLDREVGNAALLWLRAGRLASQVKRVITEEEYAWANPWKDGTPLNKIPQDKVADLLEPYAQALRIAHDAARRDHCDWGDPPLTLTNLNDYLPLDDIQSMRTLANILRFQHRLALAKGDWKEALRIARTGLTLARHLGEAKYMITHLVAIAIQAVTMNMVEEMIVQPDAPNLYWALTDLPVPMIDVRKSFRYELDTFTRSFPALRKLETDPEHVMTQGEIMTMFGEIVRGLNPRDKTPEWQQTLMLTTVVTRYYPEAKRALLDRGIAAEKVEKLPTAQVVGLYFLTEFNTFRDDVLKLANLPPWQARPLIEVLDKKMAPKAREMGNPFLLLFPAIAKVEYASVRNERNTAILRTVEAIRLYASENGGELPSRLADIKMAPAPIDPATGQTFEAYYKKTDNTATLMVPPLPPHPPWLVHYYEFTSPRKENP